MASLSVYDLISHYPVLESLAGQASTLDLFNLSLTCRSYHDLILASKARFERLKRLCPCDGHGLRQRQNFSGLYQPDRPYTRVKDREVEVRLYQTKCQGEALPCQKCGINVCDECTWYPRQENTIFTDYLSRPHLGFGEQLFNNVFAPCIDCDAEFERGAKTTHGTGLCDCNAFTRWICGKCRTEEEATILDYRDTCMQRRMYGKGTKVVRERGWAVVCWCPCGKQVPQAMRFRCTWCKRQHPPEREWAAELGRLI